MQQPRALSHRVVPLKKLAVQGSDSLMCAKALWIMGPRGGTKAAPSVVMHVGAAIPCLMARVQIPPQPLVDCVLFACFVFVLVFFSTCAHTCLPHRVAMWIKQGNVSSAA